jgi:hypothetical protein
LEECFYFSFQLHFLPFDLFLDFYEAQKGEAVDINMTVVAEEVEDSEETADIEVVEDNEHYKQD